MAKISGIASDIDLMKNQDFPLYTLFLTRYIHFLKLLLQILVSSSSFEDPKSFLNFSVSVTALHLKNEFPFPHDLKDEQRSDKWKCANLTCKQKLSH